MKTKEKITINEIAKMAGVSKTTVSRYLNGKFEYMSTETKDRITEVIEETKYQPNVIARSLKTNRTSLIGVIVSDIESPFAAPVIKSLNQAFFEQRINMIVASSNNSVVLETDMLKSMIEQRVDAILINPVKYDSPHIKAIAKDMPVILIDRAINDINLDIVLSDNQSTIREAVEHLKYSGFSSVYLFTEDFNDIWNRYEKLSSFKQSMSTYGLNELEIEQRIFIADRNDLESISKNIAKVLKNDNQGVPAILATNGALYLNIALIVRKMNLNIPYQLGLLGFDEFGIFSSNSWTQLPTVTLSSLAPNWKLVGTELVKLTLERMKKPDGVKKFVSVPVNLKIAESTKLFK